MADKATPKYDAFTVEKREGQDDWWTRIGAAFEGKNGSLVLNLQALPIGNRIVLMLWKPPKKE